MIFVMKMEAQDLSQHPESSSQVQSGHPHVSRLKYGFQSTTKRKQNPSDQPEAKRARKMKMKQTGSSLRGRLEFSYRSDDEKISLFNKMDKMKMKLGEGNMNKVSTFELLNRVFDFYISCNLSTLAIEQDNACTLSNDGSSGSSYLNDYQYATLQQATNDDLSVCMQSSLSNLVEQVYDHSQKCCKKLDIQKVKKINHATSFSLTCEDGHSETWTSSPHAEGGKFVVNLRMAHGYFYIWNVTCTV